MNIQPRHTNFVISFSFKNYLRAKSGMPKVILSHQTAINRDGVSYAYLYCVKKNILRDRIMLFCCYGLILDGKDYGVFSMEQLIRLFTGWTKAGYHLLQLHIHHLLYTDIRKIRRLPDAFPEIPVKFFLHDYYLCCKSYHLLNEQGVYCGADCLGAEVCQTCPGFRNHQNLEKMNRFVEAYRSRAELIAPSEATRDIYLTFHPDFADLISVMPHQKFDGAYTRTRNYIPDNTPIRVGYLGVPEPYKGWDTWQKIISSCRGSGDYEFYVFNNRRIDYGEMHHICVEFSESNQNPMVDAVRNSGVDVVVFWSKTPETYSFTCMEAYAAGVFMLTNPSSGNIQDFVKKQEIGMVFDSEEELLCLFAEPAKLRETLNRFYAQKHYAPLNLLDNDAVCGLFRSQKTEETVPNGVHKIRKTTGSRIAEFFYDRFVHKY